jgi:tetratricopeptide (TPR) repeat protein
MDTAHNLLFAVLALRADLIDADRFTEACRRWTSRKQVALADLLVERGWLTPADRDHVAYLVQRSVAKHGGDARASLAALADADARRSLAAIDDPDLQRYLAEALPGLAWLESPDPRFRVGVGLSLGLIALLVAGLLVCLALLGGGAWIFAYRNALVREQLARAEAAQAMAEARRQQERAEANFRKARDAVDELLARAAEPLQDLEPQQVAARQKLLEEALPLYRQLLEAKTKGHDPAVRQKMALIAQQLAECYRFRGEHAQAEETYRQAITLQEKLAAEFPDNADYRQELARSHAHRGLLLRTTGRRAEAEQAFRQALALVEKLAAVAPDKPAYGKEVEALRKHLAELGKEER